MKPLAITREYFPNLDNDDLLGIIWELTGYPSFWQIPEDGNTPEECFRKRLKEIADKMKSGISLSDQFDEAYKKMELVLNGRE